MVLVSRADYPYNRKKLNVLAITVSLYIFFVLYILKLQLVNNWRDAASDWGFDARQRCDKLQHHSQGVRHLGVPHAQLRQILINTCCPDSHDANILRHCPLHWRGNNLLPGPKIGLAKQSSGEP